MIIRSANFEKFVSYLGRKLNTPAQALIIGGTAIAFIPPINRMNKKVDQDTRDMAVGRSIGKNIVGNIVGVYLGNVIASKMAEKKS